MLHVWPPFKAVQEALEAEKHINLSLLSLIIHQLREVLDKLFAAVDDVRQLELQSLCCTTWFKTLNLDGYIKFHTGHRQCNDKGTNKLEYQS